MTVDEELSSLPDLIKLEFRLANSRMARTAQEVADVRVDLTMIDQKLTRMQQEVAAMPRALAGIVTQMLDERERRRG